MASLFSRRTLLTGSAALMVARGLTGASTAKASDLADNPIARLFHPLPAGAALPDLALDGDHGPARLSAYRGKSLLVPLWAEWCADCLIEMGDLAALQKRYGGPHFEIVPVLTVSKTPLDVGRAAVLLARVGGGDLNGLIEPKGADQMAKALCRDPASPPGHDRFALPAILLIDPHGRVVGRHIGLVPAPGSDPHAGKTIWSTPAAAAFCAALASGAPPPLGRAV